MIVAVIVLAVVAFVLGAYIAFDILRGKKKLAVAEPVKPVVPQTEKAQEAPAATESAPAAADEPETADTDETDAESEDSDEPDAESDETDADDEEKDDEVTEVKPIIENGNTRYIVIKYSKSFLAKLIQSDDRTKQYYSEIKNKLLSYDGVKSRISWKWETFRSGRKTLAKLRLRGKTLSICLALNPDDYADSKYYVESLAEVKSYADTPCMYRVKNDRRLVYAKELIARLAAENGLTESASAESVDYAAQYPYEETDALIEKKLIKVLTDKDAQSGNAFRPSEVRESVAANEVDEIMTDEVAASLIEKAESVTDKTKQGIINIDTLSQNFESGDYVTLDEIKKRIKGFSKTTYVKVLARGTLDKPLIVQADSFSLQAVKMIVLTGGKVIKNCV